METVCFWLLSAVLLALAAWLAAAGLVTAAWPHWVQFATDAAQPPARHALVTMAAWLGVLVLTAVLARMRLRAWRRTHVVITTGDGEVHIAAATINHLVREVVMASQDVVAAQVATTHNRRKMNIVVRVRLTGATPVALRATLLQSTVRQRVRETFGMDIVGTIRVMITGIRRAPDAAPQLLDWRAGAASAQHPVPAAIHG
jgi:hypothetical protein